jgi:glycogen debranching enzyme
MVGGRPEWDMDRPLVRLRCRPNTVYVSNGRTVLATDVDGFLSGAPDSGLFVHETRLLSHYRYSIEGLPLVPVSLSNVAQRSWLGYYVAPAPCNQHHDYIAPTAADAVYKAAQQAIELRLSRYVGEGMHEDLDITNFTQTALTFTLRLDLNCDFADQAETHGERRQQGQRTCNWSEGDKSWEWRSDYEASHAYSHQGEQGTAHLRRGFALRLSNASSPPRWDGTRITFAVALEPHGTWHCCLDHVALMEGVELHPHYHCRSFSTQSNEYDRRTSVFLSEAPQFASRESETLAQVVVGALEQGKRDIAALRLFDLDKNDHSWTTSAGLPLYVALFGRDTLTVSWEAAPITPDLMKGSLAVIADFQGTKEDDWRDEQPGRMIHEAHTGPLAVLNFIPQGRYYGSVTSSGFYPFVVAQLWHWTGEKKLVEPFLEPALAGLRWLDEHSDDDGFCEYQTRSEKGVQNQAWKDSDDAIVYEDGSQVPKPIATCEEQGIVYAAKMNFAEVLWWLGRKEDAKQLYREATELKKRFNETFWIENDGFFAMALDKDKRQVRSIGSNALHCVATGIADKALIERTLARLFEKDMFTGWGVRTLSAAHPAYNPYSYHRGTVWPVEHGPFAVGAYRYGCHDYVERVARSQFETASLFDFHRLPECIAGHQRDEDHPFPAVYPAANSPQGWSATTVYTLMQALLGLQPFAPLRSLFVDPFLPSWLPELTISNMRVADATVSLRFWRRADGTSDYKILSLEGSLRVIRQPSPWSMTATLGERAGDALGSFFH